MSAWSGGTIWFKIRFSLISERVESIDIKIQIKLI
jgi:hypothetical protein